MKNDREVLQEMLIRAGYSVPADLSPHNQQIEIESRSENGSINVLFSFKDDGSLQEVLVS